MNTFYLEILSPERTFYEGECVSLTLPISDGVIGIMANHTPLTAAVEDGEVTFTLPDGEKRVCAVMCGMINVSKNKTQILCESVISPEEIDEQKEKHDADEAAFEMKKHQSKKDYMMWQISLNKATHRLKIKEKEYKLN
ncbi:MAG: ATP synthase F1 subunit epsilon [Acutalibacteraceae bacterium]|nr:ATP synthase F1 subunit epsilon [Acutalibacteraceae bacterium]